MKLPLLMLCCTLMFTGCGQSQSKGTPAQTPVPNEVKTNGQDRKTAQYPSPKEIKADGPWVILQRTYPSGRLEYVRVNEGLRPIVGHTSYPRLAKIVAANKKSIDGIPTPSEEKILGDIEDTLVASLELDNESLFAGVVTGFGKKEFVFYTSNEASLRKKITVLSKRFKRPLSVEVSDDPKWDYFLSLKTDQ